MTWHGQWEQRHVTPNIICICALISREISASIFQYCRLITLMWYPYTVVKAIHCYEILGGVMDVKFTYPNTHKCKETYFLHTREWWRHQMETFSTLLALCEGISPVTGEFPSQRPVTRSFDVFLSVPEQTVEQTIERLVIWAAIAPIMTSR